MRLWPKRHAHPEDTAVRIALREVAREALALEDMLGEGLLWGDERRKAYTRAVERARVVGEMQWPASRRPPRPSSDAGHVARARGGSTG